MPSLDSHAKCSRLILVLWFVYVKLLICIYSQTKKEVNTY